MARDLLGMLLHVVATAHSFYPTLAVNDTLLAGVEGVAVATNFYPHRRLGTAGFKDIATRASHC